MEYEAVIGLEIHAQMLTESKIFCSCSTTFGAEPNSQTCPVCTGMPGVLPVLNRRVMEYAMRAALATECRIAPLSRFARKNYFYPDLPKGYQISQYELPVAEGGTVEIELEGGEKKVIRLVRIHMEEDAGKLVYEGTMTTTGASFVDYNRTGVPLMEIVSEPDMRSAAEAGAFLRQLRDILVYLDVCDGNMEQGSFRCDANISVRPMGQETLGVKAEVKNMNSFRNVERALVFEIDRQIDLLRSGGAVVQETRLWDAENGSTLSMRGKEEAHDYRYFPDPDLMPLVIDPEWIEEVRSSLPELPAARRERFVSDYGLPPYDVGVLTSSKPMADYFEACAGLGTDPKAVSNWIMGDLLRKLNEDEREITDCPVTPADLAELLSLIDKGTISGKIAKTVFEEMYGSGEKPGAIVEAKGLVQVTDEGAIAGIVDEVLAANAENVARYKAGAEKLFGFFVGQVMKATKGKANPKIVNELLRKALSK